MSGSNPDRPPASRLVPKRPPGRGSRKARGFAGEIARLQALGYTLEAIREALAEAGVTVSKSTVQREAARQSMDQAAVVASDAATSHGQLTHLQPPAASAPSAVVASDASIASEGLSGKEIAGAFVRSRPHNSLIRAKEQR